MQSEQLREEMSVASRQQQPGPKSGGERLMEALRRHDPTGSTWVPASKARQTIQQYNDLHQLGLNGRFVNSVLALACDESERLVSLPVLNKYLNPNAE